MQNASSYKQTEKDMVSGGAQPEICLCEAKMAFLKGLLQNASRTNKPKKTWFRAGLSPKFASVRQKWLF